MTEEEYVFKAQPTTFIYQIIKVSHSAFSKIHYAVANASEGLTFEGRFYPYVPLDIPRIGVGSGFDREITVNLADVGEILGQEIDRIHAADAVDENAILEVRLINKATMTDVSAPITLNVTEITYDSTGAALTAGHKRKNILRTGQAYTPDRFPSLRGVIRG